MRLKNVIALAGILAALGSAQGQDRGKGLLEIQARCSDKTLTTMQARERDEWFLQCNRELVIELLSQLSSGTPLVSDAQVYKKFRSKFMDDPQGYRLDEPFYPLFANSDGSKWEPVLKIKDGKFDCQSNNLSNVTLVGMCKSVCLDVIFDCL